DELAFEVLKEGNTNKAVGLWEKSVFVDKKQVYGRSVVIENLIKQSTRWSEQQDEAHSLTKHGDEYIVERKTETSYSIPTVLADMSFEGNWSIECDTQWL